MKAQVVLTPDESKKLIAKAIANMSELEKARQEGLVVMHPSTSTYFIFEEITGRKPDTAVWLCGAIVKKGLCVEWGSYSNIVEHGHLASPGDFNSSWIIKGDELQPTKTIDELCRLLGEKDVYVKGGNALDSEGRVGVLIGSMAEGTIGKIAAASRKRGFNIIYPMGLEKLLPISIQEASKETGSNKNFDYAMGIPCSLMPVPGMSVTEVNAFKTLAGVQALPISAGGVGGAEGSIVLLIKGEPEAVRKAVELAEDVKGAKLPQVRNPDCPDCRFPTCQMVGTSKPWV
jgi:hypothetical protein